MSEKIGKYSTGVSRNSSKVTPLVPIRPEQPISIETTLYIIVAVLLSIFIISLIIYKIKPYYVCEFYDFRNFLTDSDLNKSNQFDERLKKIEARNRKRRTMRARERAKKEENNEIYRTMSENRPKIAPKTVKSLRGNRVNRSSLKSQSRRSTVRDRNKRIPSRHNRKSSRIKHYTGTPNYFNITDNGKTTSKTVLDIPGVLSIRQKDKPIPVSEGISRLASLDFDPNDPYKKFNEKKRERTAAKNVPKQIGATQDAKNMAINIQKSIDDIELSRQVVNYDLERIKSCEIIEENRFKNAGIRKKSTYRNLNKSSGSVAKKGFQVSDYRDSMSTIYLPNGSGSIKLNSKSRSRYGSKHRGLIGRAQYVEFLRSLGSVPSFRFPRFGSLASVHLLRFPVST